MAEIRSYFNRIGYRPALKCVNPSVTEQHHRDSCDVNYILDVFQRTGKIEPGNPCYYDDVSDRPDNLLECMQIVQRSKEIFDSIPANIRARFDNNPVDLLSWLENPANRKEAGELGLLSKIEGENLQPSQSAQTPSLDVKCAD